MGFGVNLFHGRYAATWTNPFGNKRDTYLDLAKVLVIDSCRILALPMTISIELTLFLTFNDPNIVVITEKTGQKLRGTLEKIEDIQSGTNGSVFKTFFYDSLGRAIPKAVKQLVLPPDPSKHDFRKINFYKEAHFHQLTLGCNYVANGGQPIERNHESFIVMDLYEKDGTFPNNLMPINLFKQVLRCCVELESLNLFQLDMKPENLLIKGQEIYAADLGSLAFLPPFNEITSHLEKEMSFVKRVKKTDLPPFFNQTTLADKVKTFVYCSSSTGNFYATRNYSNLVYHNYINNFLNLDINDDNADIHYETLRLVARRHVIYQCARTALVMINDLHLDQQNETKIKKDLNNPFLYNIYNKMINNNTNRTIKSFYDEINSIVKPPPYPGSL